jgi:hypothetical protein
VSDGGARYSLGAVPCDVVLRTVRVRRIADIHGVLGSSASGYAAVVVASRTERRPLTARTAAVGHVESIALVPE